jgi:hypothetical protein
MSEKGPKGGTIDSNEYTLADYRDLKQYHVVKRLDRFGRTAQPVGVITAEGQVLEVATTGRQV